MGDKDLSYDADTELPHESDGDMAAGALEGLAEFTVPKAAREQDEKGFDL